MDKSNKEIEEVIEASLVNIENTRYVVCPECGYVIRESESMKF